MPKGEGMAGVMKATEGIMVKDTDGIMTDTMNDTIMGAIIIIMAQNIIGYRRATAILGMAGWIIIIGTAHIIQREIRNM